MQFGDDENEASSSSGSGDSNDSSGDAVDLSDKQGVVDPADLKKDDPPEQSLHTEEPPSPYIPAPGISGDDPRIDISGRAPDSTDLQPTDDRGQGSGGSRDSDGSN